MSTQLMNAFDPNMYNPAGNGGGQLPVGRHPVIIENAEVKAASSGNGGLVEFTLKIIDGPNAGQTGPYRLNLYNSSVKAVEIANQQLTSICCLTGQYRLGADGKDLTVLFNIPFVVEVQMQKESTEYTEITKLFDMNMQPAKKGGGNTAAQPQPQAQAPAQPQAQAQARPRPSWSAPASDQAPAQQVQPQTQQAAWGAPAQDAAPQQQAQAQAQPQAAWGGQTQQQETKPAWGAPS